ncbi:Ribbon-helix-helix protein, CopG family [Anaerofustis stercorihominis DSM 17244]|uniref:Ribbon-helix-helix protein, CopG family n=1 Tax=Anaerofustis stercorihominis DSM 17244 TaxID=445971 RepID=B1C7M3_9FIRM|nr:Ribbon-helix-helix protein, CopG family [Anaerofustis stercorihominis DSM 17244]
MSTKIGRPTDNPKDKERLTVRLDKKSSDILNEYCKQENVNKGQAIRNGIKKLEADIKK